MNFNTVAVHCRPGTKAKLPLAVTLFPEIAGIKVEDSAISIMTGKKAKLDISTVADSGSTLVRVQGTMGVDEPGVYAYRKLWQTWEAFGGALRPLFARRGITLKGAIIHGRVPRRLATSDPFYEFPSEPITQSVNHMFKYSSNFTAEMVFKTLSAQRDTAVGSWDRSSALVTGWWKERKLSGTPILKNGSGMGNTNRISPAQIVDLLSYVWNQKTYMPEYLAALSNSGFDGTLKSRFARSKLKGLIRAKTGTLNSYGISTLAGYILKPGSAPLAFAIFCHKTGHGQYSDWNIQEQILEKIGEVEGITKE
jgi:PBP4 family serine-type D-alanyl-D-alanine carboxypeptidase